MSSLPATEPRPPGKGGESSRGGTHGVNHGRARLGFATPRPGHRAGAGDRGPHVERAGGTVVALLRQSLGMDKMMAETAVLDIDDIPAVRKMAEEVRDRRSPIRLRIGGQEVAMVLPSIEIDDEDATTDQTDDEAFYAALGGWKHLVDGERLKDELAAMRGSDRPTVEL